MPSGIVLKAPPCGAFSFLISPLASGKIHCHPTASGGIGVCLPLGFPFVGPAITKRSGPANGRWPLTWQARRVWKNARVWGSNASYPGVGVSIASINTSPLDTLGVTVGIVEAEKSPPVVTRVGQNCWPEGGQFRWPLTGQRTLLNLKWGRPTHCIPKVNKNVSKCGYLAYKSDLEYFPVNTYLGFG